VPELSELEAYLEYKFKDISLLHLAVTHPSVAHEQGRSVLHNQRLEFLGDAVLGLAITRELYDKFPQYSEGPLTKGRAQLINRRTLANQARQIHLSDFLILSRGEEANAGRQRASASADAFEAVIGAIFLDGGFEAARDFVLRSFRAAFGGMNSLPTLDNPKGELQEILQSKSANAPVYEIVSATGPDHDRDFECLVTHDGVELGRGKGKSKKSAESEAALAALARLKQASADAPAPLPTAVTEPSAQAGSDSAATTVLQPPAQ
jgi:ribonuclease-3